MTIHSNSCFQDFIFKQASIGQICEEFASIPVSSSLIATDSKRGLLYIGHEKKLFVIKPDAESNPEWKLGIDLPDNVCRIALSCDCSFLAVTFSHPAAIIYDANTIHRHVSSNSELIIMYIHLLCT